MRLERIVDEFYNNFRKIQSILGKNLFNTLKKILGGEFLNYDDTLLRRYIVKQYAYFKKEHQNDSLPVNSSPDTFDRNIRNWLTDQYKSIDNNTMKSIPRNNIFAICFLLNLNDKECNELLHSINQHPLHYGGDAQETIITYCLKNKFGFERAVELFNEFVNQLEKNGYNKYDEFLYEERTIFLKEKIDLTVISNKFVDEDISSPDADNEVLEKLRLYQYAFTHTSNKTLFVVRSLKNKYEISAGYFSCFFNGSTKLKTLKNYAPVGSAEYLTKLFADIINNKTQPTRLFVLLISIISWCKSNKEISLPDFVDEALFACDMRLLNKQYTEDLFVLEIGKYKYDNLSKTVVYNYSEKLLNENGKGKCFETKAEAFCSIISEYLSKNNHILEGYELSEKNVFFEFNI